MDFGDVGAVDNALDTLNVSLDHLIKLVEDGGLETFDDTQLVEFVQGFERLRNRLPLIDHQTVRDAPRRNLPDGLCQSTLPRMLAATLRISVAEAARRVRAADSLSERMSMTGQPLQPIRPLLAAAQRTGQISPEQVGIVTDALARVDRPGFDPAAIEAGEELLTRFATPVRPQRTAKAGRTGDRRDRPRRHPAEGAAQPGSTVPPPAPHQGRRLCRGVPAHRRLPARNCRRCSDPLAKPRINTTVGPRRAARSSSRSAASRAADARRSRGRVRPAAAVRQPGARLRRHPRHRDRHHRHRRPAEQDRLRASPATAP